MVQAENTVVFTKNGSYIEDDRTGERMHMEERNGMYMLKLWTKAERTSSFRGQSRYHEIVGTS